MKNVKRNINIPKHSTIPSTQPTNHLAENHKHLKALKPIKIGKEKEGSARKRERRKPSNQKNKP